MNISPFSKRITINFDTSTCNVTDASLADLATEFGMQVAEFDTPIAIVITRGTTTSTVTIPKYLCFPGTEEGFYIYKTTETSTTYTKRFTIRPVMSKESVPTSQTLAFETVFPYDNMTSSSNTVFYLYRFANDEIAIMTKASSSSVPYVFVATYGKNNNVSSRAFLTLYSTGGIYEMYIGDAIIRSTRSGFSSWNDYELSTSFVCLIKFGITSHNLSFDRVYTGPLGDALPVDDAVFKLNEKTYTMIRNNNGNSGVSCVIECPGEVT